MKAFKDQLNNWKSLWDQQLLCEAEVADWIQSKESEMEDLFTGRSSKTLDLSTSALKKLHAELLSKGEVIDELAAWRGKLLHLPLQHGDVIGEFNRKIDCLARKIKKRIEMHKNCLKQAQEDSLVKAEVQGDLEKMVQRMERVCFFAFHSSLSIMN